MKQSWAGEHRTLNLNIHTFPAGGSVALADVLAKPLPHLFERIDALSAGSATLDLLHVQIIISFCYSLSVSKSRYTWIKIAKDAIRRRPKNLSIVFFGDVSAVPADGWLQVRHIFCKESRAQFLYFYWFTACLSVADQTNCMQSVLLWWNHAIRYGDSKSRITKLYIIHAGKSEVTRNLLGTKHSVYTVFTILVIEKGPRHYAAVHLQFFIDHAINTIVV